MARIDESTWATIRAEYATSEISYTDLSEKYGIARSVLSKRARREGWTDERIRYRENTAGRIVQKLSEQEAEQAAKSLYGLQKAADKLAAAVQIKSDRYDTSDKTTRELRDLIASLREITAVMRDLYALPTLSEERTYDLARERLDMDRKKADSGEGPGVVVVTMSPEAQEMAK